MATPTIAPTRAQVVSLLRNLLRTARKFSDYNIREYTKRRTLDGFRHNQSLTDTASIATAYSDGLAQLEVAQRQALVYSLFNPKHKSILEMEREHLNNINLDHDALN